MLDPPTLAFFKTLYYNRVAQNNNNPKSPSETYLQTKTTNRSKTAKVSYK